MCDLSLALKHTALSQFGVTYNFLLSAFLSRKASIYQFLILYHNHEFLVKAGIKLQMKLFFKIIFFDKTILLWLDLCSSIRKKMFDNMLNEITMSKKDI